jgi:hypothetical protein
VPRAALATALVALAVLAVTLRLAALAVPAAPNVITSDQPLTGTRADGPSDATGERVVVAPGVPQPGAAGPAAADSTLTRLSSALQENVRQQIWGKAWERVRDTLARASTSSGSRSHDPPTEYGDEGTTDESEEWEIARAPSGELTRRRRPGNAGQSGAGGEERADAPGPDVASRPAGGAGESDDDANGGGAGNTTSPGTLFGAPSADTDAANGSFELSLAARMRADRERGRRAAGPPPDADPDARPVLAADQRRESAAHRMAVPAAYETVVREVFAHHGAESTHP